MFQAELVAAEGILKLLGSPYAALQHSAFEVKFNSFHCHCVLFVSIASVKYFH